MKKLLSLLIVFFVLFGCTINNGVDENDFLRLKKEYSVESSFNPNLDLMNSYLNEVSLLRSNSYGSLAKALDFEIASAQAFIYFTRALEESKQINYFLNHCSTIEYKNIVSYLSLSAKYSDNANSMILLPNEVSMLRENQLETTKEINAFAKELLASIRETC